MPVVSVLMPSYNHEKYLREAIESVLNQSLKDIELIVVDDGSSDGSREIIEEYASKDKRVKPTFSERNMGIARTVNRAIDESSGRFVAFTASDDVWLPHKLERQIKILERDENYVVWSDGELIDESGKDVGKRFVDYCGARRKKKSGIILDDLLVGNFVFGTSRIVKRSNIEGIRFNENLRYHDDQQFEIELARRYEYYFIDEPLAKYRIHPKNTITSNRRQVCQEAIEFRKALIDDYGSTMSRGLKGRILMAIGHGYLEMGDRKTAMRHFIAAISLNPVAFGCYIGLLQALGLHNEFMRKFVSRLQQT